MASIAYGRLVCDQETTDKLNEFCKSIGINQVSDEYHCTILYSVNNVEKLLKQKIKLKFPLTAKVKSYNLFGDEKNCLVLCLENEKINQSFDQLVAKGASWDYPTFNPHLSLTYTFEGNELPPVLPDFDIVFKCYKVEESTSDFDPKADATKSLDIVKEHKEATSLSQLILFASKFNKSRKEAERYNINFEKDLSLKTVVDQFIRSLSIIHPKNAHEFIIKSVGSVIECVSAKDDRLFGEIDVKKGLVTFYQ